MGAYAIRPYTGTCKIWRVSYFRTRTHPKTCPILGPNLWRRTFRGVCFCAPTRVRAKIVRFHISPSGYTKNLPDFILPNKDTPKNPPGFRPKPSARGISGRMLLRPTRVRAKFVRFHIPAPEYAKNAPDFTLPNKDAPKTRPVLGANPCRRTFRGVCFCAPTRVRAKFGGF